MARANSKVTSVFIRVMMVLTVIAVVLGYLAARADQKQLEELKSKCTESVRGVCTEVISENKLKTVRAKNRRGAKSYKKRVNYSEYTSKIVYTVNGKDYEALNVRDNNPYPDEGGHIEVFYDPNDPATYYIP